MSHQCPKCGHEVSRWLYIGFLRLFSINCGQCRALLAIDNRGRYTLWGSILVSVLLAALVAQVFTPSIVYPVMVVTGFIVGVFISSHVGRIGVSPEDTSRRTEP